MFCGLLILWVGIHRGEMAVRQLCRMGRGRFWYGAGVSRYDGICHVKHRNWQ